MSVKIASIRLPAACLALAVAHSAAFAQAIDLSKPHGNALGCTNRDKVQGGEEESVYITQNALESTLTMFTHQATVSSLEAKMAKKRPRRRKKGAPGGWGTSSSLAQAMNSPQSQKLAVGAMVR